ncbi:MAG: hypothetical protein EBY20_09950 [Alphaproteobacteria bacterium]|nr:hypothetical protein [Alphaproteobacteria bacterium]
MKRVKIKSRKYGTITEVQYYNSKIKMFYCYIPHLDMNMHIHPSAFLLDIGERELDNLKMEMTLNEQENN